MLVITNGSILYNQEGVLTWTEIGHCLALLEWCLCILGTLFGHFEIWGMPFVLLAYCSQDNNRLC